MKKLALTIAAVASIGFHGYASAVAENGNARAQLVTGITLTEAAMVDFTTVPVGNGTCTMSMAGVKSDLCAGFANGTAGQFTVSGTPMQGINISVGAGSTDDGVTFNPVLDDLGNTSATSSLDATGSATVDISGSLSINTANDGLRNLTYVLTVDYN